MGFTRLASNAAATLSHTFYVDETATDPTGTPTYAIVDANGTAVSSGNATVVGGSSGRITAPLAAQSSLRRLTVTWTATVGGGSVTEVDYVEIVGGFYFTLAQGRASDTSLSDASKYPTADLALKRLEVETECETICDRSFVPRYDRVVLDGAGTSTLLLAHSDPVRSVADVRVVRSVTMAPAMDETFVAFTAAELAALTVTDDGRLIRTDGNVFTEARANVVVEFEYGLDRPPADLVQASLTRLRTRLNLNKTGIPDRTTSFTVTDGATYRLDMPGAYKTGLPEVDAIYGRYSRRTTGTNGGAVPASRTLSYSPQRYSLFHGGR
ncbi:hypothetical protein [Catelliglobosispora koreensis]|uniref:hypothetical protein n=1 Tax=Catelliglobosispora koreensis TaxID=129052 RepID=UPI00036B615F|nr:hypothetical protein [Catelliglobosispora koreensis]